MSRMKEILTLAAIAVVITIASCRKKGKDLEYNFTNHLPKAATVDIYNNKYDYEHQQNPVRSFEVGANSTYRFPLNALAEGHTYYIDWYSTDFEYNNWVIDELSNRGEYVAFKAGSNNLIYTLDPFYRGPGRSTFLSGRDTVTKWRAIDAFSFSGSAGYTSRWNTLSTNQKHKEILIRKDGISSYTFRNASGTVITNNYPFTVLVSPRAYIEIPLVNGTSYSLFGGELPTAPPPDYTSSSTDTIMAIIDDTGYEYMMVKF